MYHYAANNPVRYVDPDGRSPEEIIKFSLDIAGCIPGIGEVADFANGCISLARGDYVDAACCFISMVPVVGDAIGKGAKGARYITKATKATELAIKTSRAAKAAGKANEFVDTIKAGKRIFGKYFDLQKVTRGYNHAIEAHHLVPQALDDLFDKPTREWLSVVIDKDTHKIYTQKWNEVLDIIRNAPNKKAEILKYAERIYKDTPDLFRLTKEWLKTM